MKKIDHSTSRYFISCDWGTTSFRLKLVDIKDARIHAGLSEDTGIKKIHDRWSAQQTSLSRTGYYRAFIEEKVVELEEKARQDLSSLPVLLSGMASSSLGIQELPYRELPVSLDAPDVVVEQFQPSEPFPHPLYLISGIRSRDDVMRGEETQMIGLASIAENRNGIYLLLGTHSKHIQVEDNTMTSFRTYLTGELFELLSTKSILSNSVATPNKREPGPAFEEGVKDSKQENLLHTLFKTRTRDILHQHKAPENYDYLSGVLIGTELRELIENKPQQVLLWGNERLTGYYSAALTLLNIKYQYPELQPERDLTALGHRTILTTIDN